MMNRIARTVINQFGSKAFKFPIPMMLLGGIIAILAFTSNYWIDHSSPMRWLTILAFPGVSVVCLGVAIQQELRSSYADYLMLPELQKYYPDSIFVDFTRVAGVDAQVFYDTNMVRVSDKVFINNLLKTDKFTHMQFASAPYDGHKVFNGTLLELKEDTGIDGYIRILSTEIVEADEVTFVDKECVLTPVKIETGDDAFDKSYDVYADSEESASMILTPYVKEMLNTFLEKYGYFAICFMPNSILVSFLKPRVFFDNPEKFDYSDVPKIIENAANGIDELVASLESIINSIFIYQ